MRKIIGCALGGILHRSTWAGGGENRLGVLRGQDRAGHQKQDRPSHQEKNSKCAPDLDHFV
jgi:hypothetical protein